jgi:hypothetical protein
MDVLSLLGSTLGLGLMAGLNLYATILAVGLGIRFGWIHPAGAFAHLQVLADPWVLGIAGAAFLLEFLADKIPWVDSLWDGFHTVIRPVGAAVLGITAAGGMDPASRVILGILTGAVALTGHTTKAGTRLAVNQSPEPFSNIALSLGEDAVAVFGSWLAATHPLISLGLVVAFLLLFSVFAPILWRLLQTEWLAWSGAARHLFGRTAGQPELPSAFCDEISRPVLLSVHAIAGPGVRGLKNSYGYLCVTDQELIFCARRWFRREVRRVERHAATSPRFQRGVLLDTLRLTANNRTVEFLIPKDQRAWSERLPTLLSTTHADHP